MPRYLLLFCLSICLLCTAVFCSLSPEAGVLFLMLDEPGNAPVKFNSFYDSLSNQLSAPARALSLTQTFPDVTGGWALWPLFSSLLKNYDFKWLVVCEEDTRIHVKNMAALLENLNSQEEMFLGHGLVDRRPTVIHHYAFTADETRYNFLYPDTATGLVLSRALVIRGEQLLLDAKRRDFTIDMKHELALLFWDGGNGTAVTSGPSFCYSPHSSETCATSYEASWASCKSVSLDDVQFAVKTFHDYHKTRLVVLKRTWAKDLEHIDYFSDETDIYVPEITVLPVNNTKSGHCEKTMHIIRRFAAFVEEGKINAKWLVIADDDTLFSVPRLFRFLGCYGDTQSPLILGERYGFGFSSDGHQGYDYPTGGAGMVFNTQAAGVLANTCRCPAPDSPDDMILGMCAKAQNIAIVHNAAFHQARPHDYALDYLRRTKAISFHKHTEVDPYTVYTEWLQEAADNTKHHEHEL